ncbi:MAG: acyltransferase family protein [Pirellula sp.]
MNNSTPKASTIIWTGKRLAIVDLLRGFAAVCIVWHHLSLYAPESDLADRFAPRLGYFLYNHALYAVAIFFVLGGLTASIDKPIESLSETLRRIFDRYLRLSIPYVAMLVLLLGVAGFTHVLSWPLNQIESFSIPQLVSHLFFLQDILGYGNFSAGTWYLCIEFQWSCFVIVMAYLANRYRIQGVDPVVLRATVLFPLGLVSSWYWSRSGDWEPYFLFFAAQYILGFYLGWNLQGRLPLFVLILYALGIGASLWINPRPQLAVSLGVAAFLWSLVGWTKHWKLPLVFQWLSDISYSLFLIHYLINGLVLKAIDSWASRSPSFAAGAMLIAFLCSIAAATLFHRLLAGVVAVQQVNQKKEEKRKV